MRRLGKIVEQTMAAIAFADAGEHRWAMEVAGFKPSTRFSRFKKILERDLIHITFAEQGCYQWMAAC